jgi:Ser-tRNA(Ala) deacylase AlaX
LIDEATRVRHAKLHSAGHLIDLAVQNLGIFIIIIKVSDGKQQKAIISKMVHTSNTKVQMKIYNKKQLNLMLNLLK